VTDRDFLGEFVGWNRPLHTSHGDHVSPRQRLLGWAQRDELFIRQDVPYKEAARGSLSAKFCLVPRGKSAWSSRFFRVMFSECVPVILNDFYEPPFEPIVPVSDFVIKYPMKDLDDRFLDTLRSIPDELLEVMVARMQEHRCWYLWIPGLMDYDNIDLNKGKLNRICPEWKQKNAFMGVMRLLRRKVRVSKTGLAGTTFWLPTMEGSNIQQVAT